MDKHEPMECIPDARWAPGIFANRPYLDPMPLGISQPTLCSRSPETARLLQTSENLMSLLSNHPFCENFHFLCPNSYFHRLQLTVCIFIALLFFLTSMYIHNIILKRKRVFTTLHDVACSFLFMHKKDHRVCDGLSLTYSDISLNR